MTANELVNQELTQESNQELNLDEKKRGIASANQNSTVARIVNIIYFLFSALEMLLGVRVILRMIGVNAENGFANLIYDMSFPFVGVFESLVHNPSLGGNAVLEITTIIAMLAWALVGWLVGRFVWLVMSRPR